MISKFLQDRRGNFALVTALGSVALFGMVGLAVDYSRQTNAKTFFQDEADTISVAIAVNNAPTQSTAVYIAQIKRAIEDKFGDQIVGPIDASAVWIGKTQVQVDISATVKNLFMQVLSSDNEKSNIAVTSLVSLERRFSEPAKPNEPVWEASAIDYNRIYAYCFKPSTRARTQMTVYRDNAGTKYNTDLPTCGNGEFLSYKLHSVENARGNSKNWEKNPRIQYADTIIDENGNVEIYNTDLPKQNGKYQGQPQLETIMCNSEQECTAGHKKSIIPTGANRTPRQDKKACAPGKYFYYGWEDRPYRLSNGQRYGDNDFNDIIIVVPCDAGAPIEERPRVWISG